jgi:phage baseplate assembly protein W
MTTYRGFSTRQNLKKYTLTDFALAQQDLINYFNMRKGSKLMQPTFGTIIWDQLFEPLNETTQQIITQDINRIISYDPRLQVNSVTVTQQDTGIQIQISLTYIPTDQSNTIALNFNRNSQTLTTGGAPQLTQY